MNAYADRRNARIVIADADREWNTSHPRGEWEKGYTSSAPRSSHGWTSAPTLYEAARNKATGAVHYRHGSAARVASAPLARRFVKTSR